MRKSICGALLTLLLTIGLMATASAVDNGATPLTWAELDAWAHSFQDMALRAVPLNDPTAPEALTGEGYAFVYDFATLYMDRPDMTAESVLRGLEIVSPEEMGPHTTAVAMTTDEVLSRFYLENEDLAGTRDRAVLYLLDALPESGVTGYITRDGQRIRSIQYSVFQRVDAQSPVYTDAGVIFTLQDDLVTAISAYGLDSTITYDSAADSLRLAAEDLGRDGYSRVPVSYDGLTLALFSPEDMTFSGLTLPGATPEEVRAGLDTAADTWLETEEGYARTLSFDGVELTWVYDATKRNGVFRSMDIRSDGFEGPRGVRVGDSFSAVMCRFRFGEGDYDGTTEVLYGVPGTVPCGLAEYGEDGTCVLRYTAALSDEATAVLLISFESMRCTEIQLFTE